ncbi:hypothetical protein L332_00005 [Agrococcus pavilionensis RW1]|uniref:Uncharacterized protein n=1 Tax=Agrococcus pavilionensis RW1 TaxID=1330458 RepID=U1L7J8_9MICO|nr:hypothetical protein L332_00005 [Agrococcus pavilionensis RW1]
MMISVHALAVLAGRVRFCGAEAVEHQHAQESLFIRSPVVVQR